MSPDKEQLKARMMAEAEAVIDRMLSDSREQDQLELSDIEHLARAAGQRIMERLTSALIDAEAQGEESGTCPECEQKARYKGRRTRTLVTDTGEVRIERRYYYCPRCRKGFFPLDRRWGLNRTIYSPELARQMVWLSGLVPYGKGHQVFERIGHRQIPRWSLWTQTQQHGERLKAYMDHQQEHVGMERVVLPPPGQDHGERKGIGIDGGMVHIREEGWKEVKVGTVFDIDLRLERDRHTHDLVERPHAAHIAYTAVLGSVDDFVPAMWALAWHHGVATAADSCVTADGAKWIWRLVADLFPDSVHIVDWFHACEHLAEAARALHPDNEQAAQRWFRKRCKDLYKGEIHKITMRLDTAELTKHAHYFHTYKRKMNYQACLEEGYPIGSGTVESSVKQFKERLTGAGMRWSRRSAEQMLIIRGAVMAEDFDLLWDAA
jgi:hypothetical protein